MISKNTRLRIGLWYNLGRGGAFRALQGHVKGLLELGHYLEIWSPPGSLPLGLPITQHIVPLELELGKDVAAWSRILNVLNPAIRFRAMQTHCKTCCQQMEALGMEVIFANTCGTFAVSPISVFSKLPTLLYLQEPSRLFYEATSRSHWAAMEDEAFSPRRMIRLVNDFLKIRISRFYVREEIRNARKYARILVNSFYSRESILRAYGLESQVCYLGIDLDLFRRGNGERKFQFVSLGGLHFPKGADRCIRALARIPPSLRPALVWVGNGEDLVFRQEMELLAKELDVSFSAHINISDVELLSVLCESWAMIYAPRLEPFGFAPLEANCCGLPVVAVAEGGVRETVVEGISGYVSPSADPVDLSNACLKILQNPEKTELMRIAARDYALEKWNLSDSVNVLERHLLEVAKLRIP